MVVREVDAKLALGPNADAVIAVIERTRNTTDSEAQALTAAWEATWAAARIAAWAAVGYAARDAARDAVTSSWDATHDAVTAALTRGLITDEQYQLLAGPWESVMGPIFTNNEEPNS